MSEFIGNLLRVWVGFVGEPNALLSELCGFFPLRPLTSRNICDLIVRICRRRIVICFACPPPPVLDLFL